MEPDTSKTTTSGPSGEASDGGAPGAGEASDGGAVLDWEALGRGADVLLSPTAVAGVRSAVPRARQTTSAAKTVRILRVRVISSPAG